MPASLGWRTCTGAERGAGREESDWFGSCYRIPGPPPAVSPHPGGVRTRAAGENEGVCTTVCHCVAPLEHLRRFSPLKRPSTRQGKVGGPWQKASLQAAKAEFLQHGAISTADQPSLWRAVVCTVQDLAAPLASPHCVPVQEWQPKFLQELLVSWRKVLGAPIPTPIRMTTLTGGPSLGRDTETEIRLHRTLAK